MTVAVTPLVLVWGSTVNPSGLEMAAALCSWTSALLLVLEHSNGPPTSLVIACTAASVALILSRPLSLLWLAVIVVFVVALRPSAIRSLSADRRVRIGSACVALAALAALAWVVWAQSLSLLPYGTAVLPKTPELTIVEKALGSEGSWVFQLAGAFGWGFTSPPLVGLVLLGFAICAVLLGGFLSAERRMVVVLLALFVTALLLPVLIEISQARKVGFDWFARYSYPLYIGVILVAGAVTQMAPTHPLAASLSVRRAARRLVILVVSCVAGSQFVDVLWAVRRYTVGLSGPLNFFAHVPGDFSPPVPVLLLVIAALFFCAAYAWLIIRICGDSWKQALPPCLAVSKT